MWDGGRPLDRNGGSGPSPPVVWFQHGLQIFYKDSGRTARWRKLEAGVNICEGEWGARRSLETQSAVAEALLAQART